MQVIFFGNCTNTSIENDSSNNQNANLQKPELDLTERVIIGINEYPSISFKLDDIGTTIFYSLDGSDPSPEQNIFSIPIKIMLEENFTLKAVAKKDGFEDSEILEQSFIYIQSSSPSLESQCLSVSPYGIGNNIIKGEFLDNELYGKEEKKLYLKITDIHENEEVYEKSITNGGFEFILNKELKSGDNVQIYAKSNFMVAWFNKINNGDIKYTKYPIFFCTEPLSIRL